MGEKYRIAHAIVFLSCCPLFLEAFPVISIRDARNFSTWSFSAAFVKRPGVFV